jgi:chloramphenicol O-acetyltransferase
VSVIVVIRDGRGLVSCQLSVTNYRQKTDIFFPKIVCVSTKTGNGIQNARTSEKAFKMLVFAILFPVFSYAKNVQNTRADSDKTTDKIVTDN